MSRVKPSPDETISFQAEPSQADLIEPIKPTTKPSRLVPSLLRTKELHNQRLSQIYDLAKNEDISGVQKANPFRYFSCPIILSYAFLALEMIFFRKNLSLNI